MDEILVKGQDGKWYLLKGEELLPYGEGDQVAVNQVAGVVKEGPKGVGEEVHAKLERHEARGMKQEAATRESPPAAVRPATVSHEEHPLRLELDELVDRVVTEIQNLMPRASYLMDHVLTKRFRTIVSARLRDVRDALETRETLTRPVKIGGLGLAISGGSASGAPEAEPRAIDRVMEVIEKAFGEFQAKWKAVEVKRREEWQLKQREQREQRDQQDQLKEQQELEERYARLTGGIPKSQFPISKEIPKPKIPPGQRPLRAGGQTQKVEETKPVQPAIITLLPKPLPTKAVLPTPRPYTLTPSPSQKITDIRPAPKILGPVEELRSLTLEDFRRIPGANAAERIQKIVGKIEFLGQESLGRRAQGLEAWRTSPLHSLYSQIVSSALALKITPEAVISKLVSEGKPTLTLEEFHGIMEMNQRLRF